MTVRAVSNGNTGVFNFSGTNGFAAQSITTTAPGTSVAAPAQALSSYGTATTITQAAPPAGSRLTGISCTGLGNGGTATPTINGTAGGSVLLNSVATAGSRTVECTFTNVGPPTLTKAADPTTFSSGGNTTLSFTLTNPTGSSVATASFVDTLPTGLVVAATPAIGGSCTNATSANVVTATAGGKVIAVSGILVPAAASCTVTVALTNSNAVTNSSCAASPPVFTNGAGNISGLNGALNGVLPVCVVVPAPSTGSSGVRVPTDRQAANATAKNQLEVLVRDAAGAGVGGQTVSFAATPGVDLGGGVGAAFSCVTAATGLCSVHPSSAIVARYSTAVSLGAAALGGNFSVSGNRYVASPVTYSFVLPAPIVGKTFVPNAVSPKGPSTLTVTLTNASTTQHIDGAVFTDTYPAGLVNSSDPAAATTCSAGRVTAAAGSGSLALSGATIPASGSCNVTVQVTAASVGSYTNVLPIGSVAAANAASSAVAASAVLAVRTQAVVRVQKVTTGGVGGPFAFTQTNLVVTPAPITPVAANTPAPPAPASLAVSVIRTAVTLDETPVAHFLLTDARCSDANAAVTGNSGSFGTLSGSILTLPAGNVLPGADMLCVFTSVYRPGLAGRVFTDTGTGGGVPNDGLANGGEKGRAGVIVTLGDCAAIPYASSVTDGGGRYSLLVPASVLAGGSLCVEAPHSADRLSTGASVGGTALALGVPTSAAGSSFTYRRDSATDRIALAWAGTAAAPIGAMDFASVPVASWVAGGLGSGGPGTSVIYSHMFTAGSGGSLSFSVTDAVSTPVTPGWSQRVFADPGCTGRLQERAATLFPPAVSQAVTAGQVVCVILQDSIPAQAPQGSHNASTLQASFVFSNASPPLSAVHRLDDVTTVSTEALELHKEVRNVSQATSFGLSNQAKPGDTLEYRITYRNTATSPLNNLSINDTTPAYTSFMSATAGSMPSSFSACSKTTPANAATPVDCTVAEVAGGRGALGWRFTGSLQPGDAGSVWFQVHVD